MDPKQIHDALDRLFNQEGERIVFWNDPEREFLDFMSRLPFLVLGKTVVNLVRLNQGSALETKIRLERQDPTGRYLLYSPTEEPDYESDWLLDIRLYSRSFRADRASILLDELGLANQHLEGRPAGGPPTSPAATRRPLQCGRLPGPMARQQ